MTALKICFTAVFLLLLNFSIYAQQTPRIYSISPNVIQSGAAALPLVVSGSNFKNAVVKVNGVELETIAIAWNKLRATVPASMVASPANLQVSVVSRRRSSGFVALTVVNAPVGSPDWTALTARLQSFVPATVTGLTMLISKNGKVVYSQAFGDQTVNSVLAIASSTKMPSMLTAMTLVDAGLINLDVPISTYLNGYAVVPPDKANVTMRMIMNHTSGMGDDNCLNDRLNTTLKLCTQAILNRPLQFVPGSRFDYGGSGMQVVGGVVEAVSGESWNAYFNRKIATPLGLTRFTYTNSPNPRIAGGAFSDVGDYNRILQTFLAGGVYGNARILSNNGYRTMMTDQIVGLPYTNSPGGPEHNGYSFGWWHTTPSFLQSQPLPRTIGPELSDPGAFGCTPWIDFENNYTAIILIDSTGPTGTMIWDSIRPLIIEQMN